MTEAGLEATAAGNESGGDQPPLSAVVREASRSLHDQAESTPFITRFMDGTLPRDGYVRFLSQLWFVYAALEAKAEHVRIDPKSGPFVMDDLARTPALEADLAGLVGPHWRSQIEPGPAAARYRDRLTRLDPVTFVAHHYTRYLGDISGGQFLRLAARKSYGFTDASGASFYHFPDSVQPGRLRVAYRRRLDETPWSGAERDRLVAEVVVAFRLNVDLLEELGGATGG